MSNLTPHEKSKRWRLSSPNDINHYRLYHTIWKLPQCGLFLVRVFLYSKWRYAEKSPSSSVRLRKNTWQKKLCKQTFFPQSQYKIISIKFFEASNTVYFGAFECLAKTLHFISILQYLVLYFERDWNKLNNVLNISAEKPEALK